MKNENVHSYSPWRTVYLRFGTFRTVLSWTALRCYNQVIITMGQSLVRLTADPGDKFQISHIHVHCNFRGDDLHEISKPIFSGKKGRKK